VFEREGETRDKIILGKILGTKPEFRTKVKEISMEISEIVSSVNKLSIDEQKKEIDENFPEILVPKEKIKEREGLPELKNAQQGNVITRFPPEPNGYPHIGHAKAAIINSEYAKMYGGKFILRMDDTNPEAERMEYHAAIKVGLEWLGIEFDIVKSTSDDMEVFYEKGIELINSGKSPIHEDKLENLLTRNVHQGRLRATTDLDEAINHADVSMIAVGTPFDCDSIDLSYLKKAASDVGNALRKTKNYHVVCVKSTVVPGTTDCVVGPIISEASGKKLGEAWGLVMNPEFLAEGTTVLLTQTT
jgi:hypothetical protein